LKNIHTKLIIIIIPLLIINGCTSIKNYSKDDFFINEIKIFENKEELKNSTLNFIITTQPNKKFFSIPLGLKLYNLSNPIPDSSFNVWLNKKKDRKLKLEKLISEKQLFKLKNDFLSLNSWLKTNGEAPAYFKQSEVNISKERIKKYYKNLGYFDVDVSVEKIYKKNHKVNLNYNINLGDRYYIDSISADIESIELIPIYNKALNNQIIKKGNPFVIKDLENERKRIINLFRNNGIYNFEQRSINFYASIDSSGLDHKIPIKINIENPEKRINNSLKNITYKVSKINEINLFVESKKAIDATPKYSDSIHFKEFKIFSNGPLKYNPEILTSGIYIRKNQIYSDTNRKLTYRFINNLQNFKYPGIYYTELDSDSLNLKASITLAPKDKFSLGFDLDLSHSNIQDVGIGIGGSLSIRNVFKGAEILELSLKNNLGASTDISQNNNQFFNLYELSADAKLSLPRIKIPFLKSDLINVKMDPKTQIIFGTGLQKNIGLDKQFFSVNYQYDWKVREKNNFSFKLIDLEFVNNKNINNYFNVYRNSYERINNIAAEHNKNNDLFDISGNLKIPQGVRSFINDVLNETTQVKYDDQNYQIVNNVNERLDRLTSNNLILGSSFNLNYNSQESYFDEVFFQFRWKFDWVGNFLNSILKKLNDSKNVIGQNEIDGVAPSQYIKTEIDYIKHWKIGTKRIFAFHFFSGLAIPYGNSNNIPFSRSFFSGGANDNRAWKAYKLGPGSSNNINEFNEANFKIALNFEYRFPLYGKLNGAFFVDSGNIWNVFDDVKNSDFRFDGIKDLNEIAIGSGLGMRYDFDFFVLRFDTGFKSYNPALEKNNRWWSDFSLNKAVFNIGINYPF
jgi:outer membrane protein assembly factor BamA